MYFYYLKIEFGRNRGSPRIVLGAAGVSKDHFGGIPCRSYFSRISKIMNNYIVECFPFHFLMKLGAIDAEPLPGHGLAIGLFKNVPFAC